jgi:hypothetical protein
MIDAMKPAAADLVEDLSGAVLVRGAATTARGPRSKVDVARTLQIAYFILALLNRTPAQARAITFLATSGVKPGNTRRSREPSGRRSSMRSPRRAAG